MQTFTVIAPHNCISQILPRLKKVVKWCKAGVDKKRVSCYNSIEIKKRTQLLGGTSAPLEKDSVMPVYGISLPLFLNRVNIPQDQKLNSSLAYSIQVLPFFHSFSQGGYLVATSKFQRQVRERLLLLLRGYEIVENFYIARIKLLSIPDLSKYPSIYRRELKPNE